MIYGKINDYDGETLYIAAPFNQSWLLEKQNISEVELSLIDGRRLSGAQRRKVFALLRDISLHTGHTPEELKEIFKCDFIAKTGAVEFSLSNCDMTTARLFIDHLVEFCLDRGVACQDSLLEMAEDIGRYIYLCLVHRKCCITGKRAQLHHVDAVGMGRDRKEICHLGMRALPLSPKMHKEAHQIGDKAFSAKYHVFGIKLDEFLCKKLKLGRTTNA